MTKESLTELNSLENLNTTGIKLNRLLIHIKTKKNVKRTINVSLVVLCLWLWYFMFIERSKELQIVLQQAVLSLRKPKPSGIHWDNKITAIIV